MGSLTGLALLDRRYQSVRPVVFSAGLHQSTVRGEKGLKLTLTREQVIAVEAALQGRGGELGTVRETLTRLLSVE